MAKIPVWHRWVISAAGHPLRQARRNWPGFAIASGENSLFEGAIGVVPCNIRFDLHDAFFPLGVDHSIALSSV
jgi:hypothetical protein